jgi:hypothetical protein
MSHFVFDHQIYNSAQEVKSSLNQNVGFNVNRFSIANSGVFCNNDSQPNKRCLDYQVRFCCGKLIFSLNNEQWGLHNDG